jgi:hypothetical protein
VGSKSILEWEVMLIKFSGNCPFVKEGKMNFWLSEK